MMKLGKNELKELQKQMPKLPKQEYNYHCICDNCNFSWYSNKDYDIQTYCPSCMSGEVYVYKKGDDNY